MRSGGGFTLVEVIIAVAILGFVLFAVVPLVVTTLGVNRSVSLDVRAQTLAAQKIEEMKVLTADGIEDCLGGNTSCSGTDVLPADDRLDRGITYTRQWSINRMPVAGGGANPAPVILTATVQYTYRGETRTRALTSLWGY